MPKPAQGAFPHWEGVAYNEGYGAGYARAKPRVPSEVIEEGFESVYYRAYITGSEDRLEDEEAMELGQFDLLNEEERRYLYGDEVDHV